MITRKSLKLIILASFCVLGIITAIPGFMLDAQKTNISSVQSALLNPKYTDKVNEITLSFPDGCSLLFKKGLNRVGNDGWTCTTSDGTAFPVNATIITQMLERASETRSMAEVSDSFTSWSALGLSDDAAVNVTFGNNSIDGKQVYSSLFFGYGNADATMIYVRNDRKSTSWRIQDCFSSYLSDSMTFWADQRVLPIGSISETDTSRTQINVLTSDQNYNLYNDISSATQFDDTIHTLLSLRSSELLSIPEFTAEAPQAVPVMTVTLCDTTGPESAGAYGFTVYQAVFEDGIEYFARNFGITSEDYAPYVLQISEWTCSKLVETLTFN